MIIVIVKVLSLLYVLPCYKGYSISHNATVAHVAAPRRPGLLPQRAARPPLENGAAYTYRCVYIYIYIYAYIYIYMYVHTYLCIHHMYIVMYTCYYYYYYYFFYYYYYYYYY